MKKMSTPESKTDLPTGIGKPALRALAGAGITQLSQLAKLSEHELLQMHGIGPKALGVLRQALADRRSSFARPSAKR